MMLIKIKPILSFVAIIMTFQILMVRARASQDSTQQIAVALANVKASVVQLESALAELKKENPGNTSSIKSLELSLEKDLKSLSLEIKSIEDQIKAGSEPIGKKIKKDFAELLKQIGSSLNDAAKKLESESKD